MASPKFDWAKIAFFAACGVVLIGAGFALGIYIAVQRGDLLSGVRKFYVASRSVVDVDSPKRIANRFDGQDGLTQFADFTDDGFILLAGYFPGEGVSAVKLMRVADGAVVKDWYPDPAAIRASSDYPDFYPVERFQPKHPLLMDDGGLIFIDNQGPLVRVDGCSEIVWILDGKFHHSIERGVDGTLVVPLALENAEVDGVTIRDEAVAEVSLEGELLRVTSVAGMLLDSGYRGLLLGTTPLDDDPLHLNDVEVARETTEHWQRGDWLLSIRSRSAIALYRPSTERIVWIEIGPWTMQNDPDFQDDGTISIFGNDAVKLVAQREQMLGPNSNLYILQPGSGMVETPYVEAFEQQQIRAVIDGKIDLLANGDALIEESDRGRLSRIDQDGFVWVFQNSQGDDAGVLHWSRYLSPADVAGVDLDQDCES